MGVSKIVVHDQRRFLANSRNCLEQYQFNSSSRVLIPVPIAHSYGLGTAFLPAVMVGASIELQEKTNLLRYLDRERHFRPTLAFATPSLCKMLMEGFRSVRTTYQAFVVSTQHFNAEDFRAFDDRVGGVLINQYGNTEMCATAACSLGDEQTERATTIGRPMPGVELKIGTLESECTTSGYVGELQCKHPFGFEGYIDQRGEWLLRMGAEAWYSTGDIARSAPKGSLVLLGRSDACVNRSGYLVLLTDIEEIMNGFENVSDTAVVVGKRETLQGHYVVAFCVPRMNAQLNADQIRRHCFDLLPRFAVPDEVRLIDTLPTLPSGKIDSQALVRLLGK
jgi:acyl-coenzyme A synthetase/AMP-(fatty) acid ligase